MGSNSVERPRLQYSKEEETARIDNLEEPFRRMQIDGDPPTAQPSSVVQQTHQNDKKDDEILKVLIVYDSSDELDANKLKSSLQQCGRHCIIQSLNDFEVDAVIQGDYATYANIKYDTMIPLVSKTFMEATKSPRTSQKKSPDQLVLRLMSVLTGGRYFNSGCQNYYCVPVTVSDESKVPTSFSPLFSVNKKLKDVTLAPCKFLDFLQRIKNKRREDGFDEFF